MHLHRSTKSDHYLGLCLDQASLSPLNHRHGAIIVKGGKVLGAGFNDYRPGFNGGTLKTGAQMADRTTVGLTAPSLSMHSEMMAIHAALGSKAAAGRGIKGARPLAGSNAKQSRVAVEEYVEAVLCAALPLKSAERTAIKKSAKWRFKRASSEFTKSKRTGENGAWKGNIERNEKNGESKSGHRSGKKQRQQQHLQAARRSSSLLPHSSGDDASSDDDADSGKSGGQSQDRLATASASRRAAAASRVPKARRNVQQRKRHPRLTGADLYVARLGKPGPAHRRSPSLSEDSAADSDSARVAARLPPVPALTGSLHDELVCKRPKPSPCSTPDSTTSGSDGGDGMNDGPPQSSKVAKSRPCYRCISYMHHVGIKRVFWTNSAGVWEGAKVRDLMDSLEAPRDGGSSGMGLFVTKHEVLLLLQALVEDNR